MSAYEDFKDRWQGQEGSLCSIAISLKRIADKLTADDVAVDRSAAGINATPSPAGPDSGDDSQPDGPVVDGRTVKVGDRVRLRSGDVLPVLEVMRYPDTYYPWLIRHYANRRPELYGSTGRQMHEGVDHHNDIVGFVDEPETQPSPAPVDLSGLRPGDVLEFRGGLRATVQWAQTRGDLCAMTYGIPMRGIEERVSMLYKVDGEPGMPGLDGRHLPAIVRVIKRERDDGSA